MTETQQRFLKEIADRVSGGRIAELRLYPTVRVGQVESGVAIVATMEQAPEQGAEAPAEEVSVGAARTENADTPDPTPQTQPVIVDEAVELATVTENRPESATHSRLSILTAHFRHTVKGPDRGKWEFSLVHDADAPIETIENVVRGVARRAGEDGEPELLSGDDFQRALTEPWWNATT